MEYNTFENMIERRNTGSVKWDRTEILFGAKDLLPMWVADMDFPSPPEVQEALISRIKHPVFGYTAPSESIYTSIINWMEKRHSWTIQKEWITFSPGIVAAIGTAINALTEPGDKVMIQSPVYTPFFDMIKNNNRTVVNNQLSLIEDHYEINFEDFEQKLKSGVKMVLLCSPHNPGGRIWRRTELQKIGELCLKYQALVVSDEIHGDLSHSGLNHLPLASIDSGFTENVITLMAPSKTFNIAGLQSSLIICSDTLIQNRLNEYQHKNGFHGLNLFALTATEAAYLHGEAWLNSLLTYLQENIRIAEEFIKSELPQLRCIHPEASYLLWIDCRKLGLSGKSIQERLISKGKIALEPGEKYGPGGEGFVRMNIGCPRSTLLDGLSRLKTALA
ncbi:MalY/PatB family protein [Actinomycetes bacterium NPDC127524]